MKKLLVFVSLVFATLMVNAASINWVVNVQSIKTVDGSANLNGGAVYFLMGNYDTAALSASIEAGTFLTDYSSNILDNGKLNPGGGKTSSAVSGLADGTFNFYTIFFDTGTYDAAGYYRISDVLNLATYTPPATAVTATFTSANTGAWVQVPEPATMALLGIGVVAVGLRRRRK